MSDTRSFFTDGKAYDALMGPWTRATGEIFLDWLALPKGLRWLDVGCGTGCFTELVQERCAPSSLCGIDPAPDQIAYAGTKPTAKAAAFRIGDAQALRYEDGAFDAAVMALVIGFIPDPLKAVAEMKRVVTPGGTVAAYVWDFPGKGYIQQPLRDALAAMGVETAAAGNPAHSRLDVMRGFFETAGLAEVAARAIGITVSYGSFAEFWSAQTALANPSVAPIRKMSAAEVERLKAYLRAHLPTDAAGRIAYPAHANAVKGRVLG